MKLIEKIAHVLTSYEKDSCEDFRSFPVKGCSVAPEHLALHNFSSGSKSRVNGALPHFAWGGKYSEMLHVLSPWTASNLIKQPCMICSAKIKRAWLLVEWITHAGGTYSNVEWQSSVRKLEGHRGQDQPLLKESEWNEQVLEKYQIIDQDYLLMNRSGNQRSATNYTWPLDQTPLRNNVPRDSTIQIKKRENTSDWWLDAWSYHMIPIVSCGLDCKASKGIQLWNANAAISHLQLLQNWMIVIPK